jgi:pimeloyl-ACP methyl ester carboxylesterase
MSTGTIINDWKDKGTGLAVAGANTFIWRYGQGETVVCLHGVPSSAFLYRKVLHELSLKGLQGVAFDFPGLGFADRPRDFDYSWSRLSKWTVDAIDAAEIDHFHLVVHDIGGPIGFDVIRRIPDRIRSLTALNTIIKVAAFHRPWVMEPFAHPGLGWLWLQFMRTPLIVMLMRMIGVCDKPTYGELMEKDTIDPKVYDL